MACMGEGSVDTYAWSSSVIKNLPKAMAPASVLARAAEGRLTLTDGLGDDVALEDPLGLGEVVDDVVAVVLGFGSSSPPLQPANRSVAAVAAATAYVIVVRFFIVRIPSVVRCLAATRRGAKHRVLLSRVEKSADSAT